MTEEPRKVWLVSHGAYSDYMIDGAFSTLAGAEAYRDWMNGPEEPGHYCSYGIEEYELDTLVVQQTGCFLSRAWSTGGTSYQWCPEEVVAPPRVLYQRGGTLYYEGRGKTKEHARRSRDDLIRAVRAGTVIVSDTETP